MTSRASISRSPFTNTNSRARTPTLMRGQPADAVCRRAPARLHRFTKVTVGVPFADSARDLDAIGSRVIWFQDNHSDSPCFTALSGVGLLVAYAPRRGVIGHTTGSVTKGRETSSGQVGAGAACQYDARPCLSSRTSNRGLAPYGRGWFARCARKVDGWFFVSAASFPVPIFSAPAFLSVALTASPNHTSPPLRGSF